MVLLNISNTVVFTESTFVHVLRLGHFSHPLMCLNNLKQQTDAKSSSSTPPADKLYQIRTLKM